MSPRNAPRTTGREPVVSFARIVVLVLAVLCLIFIFQNTAETELRVIFPRVTMPLWLALLITAVIGALCGAFAARSRRRR